MDLDRLKLKSEAEKVYQSIINFPYQLEEAYNGVIQSSIPRSCTLAKNVVIAGMGGSALGGRIIDSLTPDRSRTPIEVFTEYHIPNYVNKDTLVILSSYSGNTEETLADANQALKKEAQIFVLTAGGKLAQLAKDKSLGIYQYNDRFNPSKQPRMALGSSLGALLGILSACEFIHLTEFEIDDLVKEIKSIIDEYAINKNASNNVAKTLAFKLKNKIPVLVASEHLVGSAHTMKNQFNETAKTFCVLFDLPEANHHLLEGLKNPPMVKQYFQFLFFESQFYSPRVIKRYPITQEVVEKNDVSFITYPLRSCKKISQTFEVVILGLFTAFYLSLIYGENPVEIPWVDYFKKRLDE